MAVIGDGAFPSGIVYEAMNNAGGMKKPLLVILNDNEMSICPRVGGMANYLDRLRSNPFYTGLKTEITKILNNVPLFGDPAERFLAQLKEAVKAGVHGGMLFEELGFRYFGPIEGHNIRLLRKYLEMVKGLDDPVLLHVVTEKGHGYQPAADDPVFFHAPPQFHPASDDSKTAPTEKTALTEETAPATAGGKSYTQIASAALARQMAADERVTVLTAAMCQGNKLEAIRRDFPTRFFDTGICESHAVAFAAGQAKAGLRPVVDIYSTFLQRSFDQIFQEVSLQNLPLTFLLDRSGVVGPDGPTHHGVFDLAFMRIFPNMVVMAPGDAHDLEAMIAFRLSLAGPCSIRYPKSSAETAGGERTPLELGQAEVLRSGADGAIVCCGALLSNCLRAADRLREQGIEIEVINARFLKPLDEKTILPAVRDQPFVLTVEEGVLAGGFGSAVLEAAAAAGLDASKVSRLGIPDHYIEHAERKELLADLQLDAEGVFTRCSELLADAGRDIERVAR